MRINLRIWLEHFEHHARWPLRVPPALPDPLSDTERATIGRSIATFQRGERSEGRTLQRLAERFASQRQLPELPRITTLFIAEEARHAELLAGYMADHGIPERRQDWTDSVFRALRRCAGYEAALAVLLTAELIGNVYYRALEGATGSRRLQALCRVMVADELAHVAFESELLLEIRRERGLAARLALAALHRAFFAATAAVVWATHRQVFASAGLGFTAVLRACIAQYSFYLGTPRTVGATGASATLAAASDPVAQRPHGGPAGDCM
jgi:hypothetical protein